MSIRSQFVEKWNYTGRKRIKQRPELFNIEAIGRKANEASFRIDWDLAEILSQTKAMKQSEHALVLDAMFLGNTRRFELKAGHSQQKLVIDECPDDAVIDFRIKLVSTAEGSRGALIAASSWFKLKGGLGDDTGQSVSSGFFKLNLADSLGEQIWKISWPASDDPQIFLNRRYHNKFKDTAVLRCHLFPEILRGVLLGILFRNESLDAIEEGSVADNWLTFVEQRLATNLRGEDAEVPDDPEGRLDLVDRVVEDFSQYTWKSGKSLLEEALK